ncbi:MAG: hypothetical protein OEW82_01215 [Dehalococcoidia bacterium]|nr:hypothetical protein [Dehalococcoidia bacterium]
MRNKLRFLAIIAVGVLLLPAGVLAQPPSPPLLFQGSVIIDGVDAPVGTVISAEVEGVEVATNAPGGIAEAGQYALTVPNKDYTGKIVVFKVDGVVGGQCEYADPMKTSVVSFDLSVEVGSPPAAPPPGGTPFPGGLSTRAMIGIVAAVVVVIAVIVFLVVRRRRRYN